MSSGVLLLVAGVVLSSGNSGNSGPATAAQLNSPRVGISSWGDIYIADSGNNRIRKVNNAFHCMPLRLERALLP